LQRGIAGHSLVSDLRARAATGTTATAAATTAPAATSLALDPRVGKAGSHRLDRLGRLDLARPSLAHRSRLIALRTIFAGAIVPGAFVAGTFFARGAFPARGTRFARSAILARRDCLTSGIAAPVVPIAPTANRFASGRGLRAPFASRALFAPRARGARALLTSTTRSAARTLFASSATRAAAFAALLGFANRATGTRGDAHPIRPRAEAEESVRAFIDHRDHCLGA
jgi:hypothetical protein